MAEKKTHQSYKNEIGYSSFLMCICPLSSINFGQTRLQIVKLYKQSQTRLNSGTHIASFDTLARDGNS